MAQVLSIVAEAGIEGFEYDSGVNFLTRTEYQSRKFRISVVSSPKFAAKEFRYYLAYAARAGFVDAGENQTRLANGELSQNEWHIMLTLKGWEQIELHDRPILHQWGANLRDNVPTILVSVIGALAAAWLLSQFGLIE